MGIARLVFSLLLAVGISAISVQSRAQVAVGISVRIGPPILPVYVQPVCPGPDYIWIPGYWAYDYDDEDYYWVPGTWVIAPEPDLLWTPGYWGWNDGFYIWHAGYWGPVVGYYGGINYGFGYPGVGFYGGYWHGGSYYYNRSVTNVNVNIVHNTYNTTVVNNNTTVNRVSFNGGPGGISARPTHSELAAEHERHVPMTTELTAIAASTLPSITAARTLPHRHVQASSTAVWPWKTADPAMRIAGSRTGMIPIVRRDRARTTDAATRIGRPLRGRMTVSRILGWTRNTSGKLKRYSGSRIRGGRN